MAETGRELSTFSTQGKKGSKTLAQFLVQPLDLAIGLRNASRVQVGLGPSEGAKGLPEPAGKLGTLARHHLRGQPIKLENMLDYEFCSLLGSGELGHRNNMGTF